MGHKTHSVAFQIASGSPSNLWAFLMPILLPQPAGVKMVLSWVFQMSSHGQMHPAQVPISWDRATASIKECADTFSGASQCSTRVF